MSRLHTAVVSDKLARLIQIPLESVPSRVRGRLCL